MYIAMHIATRPESLHEPNGGYAIECIQCDELVSSHPSAVARGKGWENEKSEGNRPGRCLRAALLCCVVVGSDIVIIVDGRLFAWINVATLRTTCSRGRLSSVAQRVCAGKGETHSQVTSPESFLPIC